MKHKWLSTTQAMHLIHADHGFVCMRLPREDGDSVLLETGAKLYARKRGCVLSYLLSGYAEDGSDIDNALKKMQANINHPFHKPRQNPWGLVEKSFYLPEEQESILFFHTRSVEAYNKGIVEG